MTVPTGAIVNSAVSLAKAVKEPTLSNVLAISESAALLTGNPETTAIVKNGTSLITAGAGLLGGQAGSLPNTINSAVKLAQGFLDPKTAGVVGQLAGGLNGILGLGPQFGAGGGNKPIALHTDTMPTQDMTSAYSQSKDVIFTFVRMDSVLSEGEDLAEAGQPGELSNEVSKSMTQDSASNVSYTNKGNVADVSGIEAV